MKQCIMLTLKNKMFFTTKNNLYKLINLSEKLKCEIHLAKTEEKNILSLAKLAEALCNNEYKSPKNYTITKPIQNTSEYSKELEKIKLNNYIIENLFSGKELQLKDIENKFKTNKKIINTCIKKIQEDFSKKGFQLQNNDNKLQLVK